MLCTDDAHYSQQANFYEKYPEILGIRSFDQIPANIVYIFLTHSRVLLQGIPLPLNAKIKNASS